MLCRPGQLCQDLRSNHAPTALEGVQAPAQFDQGVAIGAVGLPARPHFIEQRQQLVGFFKEYLAQLVIDRRFFGRHYSRHYQRRRFWLKAITQGSKAVLSRLEEPRGIGLGVGNQPLQVALAGAQGLGQFGQGSRICQGFTAQQLLMHIVAAMTDQRRCARQHQHRQGATNLLQQARQRLQALGLPAGVEAIADQVLDLLHHGKGFFQHQLANLDQIGAR
ncbi:hypothetical protein D3C81_1004660 [compost metagenome]